MKRIPKDSFHSVDVKWKFLENSNDCKVFKKCFLDFKMPQSICTYRLPIAPSACLDSLWVNQINIALFPIAVAIVQPALRVPSASTAWTSVNPRLVCTVSVWIRRMVFVASVSQVSCDCIVKMKTKISAQRCTKFFYCLNPLFIINLLNWHINISSQIEIEETLLIMSISLRIWNFIVM